MKEKVHYWTSKHYKCNTKTMCFEKGDKQITRIEFQNRPINIEKI